LLVYPHTRPVQPTSDPFDKKKFIGGVGCDDDADSVTKKSNACEPL